MLRYGILSTSSIAPRFISAVRAANAGVIAAISSRTLEKAESKAKEWSIPVFYGDHNTLLSDPNINIVYISTVNSEHYKWAKAALECGKHVVCEKPCTTSEYETRTLFDIAKKNKRFFMEADKMLFLPVINDIKQLINAKVIGEVYMADISHSFPGTYNDWMYDRSLGGGPLLSSGIYAVQLLMYYFGEISDIKGRFDRLSNGCEWQYSLTGSVKNGTMFIIKNSTKAILDNKACFFGTEGWIEIPSFWKARKAIVHYSSGVEKVIEYPCEHELIYEALHIKECIEKGLIFSPVMTEEISIKGIRILRDSEK